MTRPHKPVSQCDRILAVLADGCEHEMRDIHRVAGFCRLNSRVSELRSRGHEITCRREGACYFYRLVDTLNEPPQPSTPLGEETAGGREPTAQQPSVLGGGSLSVPVTASPPLSAGPEDGDAGTLTLFDDAAPPRGAYWDEAA